MIALWGTGCLGVTPWTNDAPYLISFNGAAPFSEEVSGPQLMYVWSACACGDPQPGEPFPLEVVAEDPEGDDVLVWFLGTSSWVEFDPHGTSGAWHVPADNAQMAWLDLVLEDDRDPPARRTYLVDVDPSWCTASCEP